jgi:hypothetical protein
MIHKVLQKDVQCRPSPNAMGEAFQMKLAADTAEFLSRGGVVQQCDNAATAEKYKDRTSSEIKAIKRKFNDGAM